MAEQNEPKSRHQVAYWQMRPLWIDYLNFKEPIEGTLSQYLFKYPAEDDGEYRERLKRLAQVNFVDILIDFYIAMLFSTNVQVDAEKFKDEVMSFVGCCNLQGDTLTEYFRQMIAPNALLYGVTDVFVDLPRAPDTIKTLADQKAAGIDQPYCYIVPPLNRTDWALNALQQYTYYRSEDVINTQVAAQFNIKDPSQNQEWTETTEWRESDITESRGYKGKEPEVDDPVANPYNMIPAVAVIPLPSMRFYSDKLGLSLVKDIVPLQRLAMNLISLMMDTHEQSNFSQRVLIQDTKNGDMPPDEGEMKEAGPKRGLVFYGENTKFAIVSPDPAGVEAMRCWLAEIIDRMYQSALVPSDANVNKTHQSGNTIRANLSQLYNRLTLISNHFAKAYKQIIEMSLRVRKLDPTEAKVSVQWDTNFAYEAVMNSIQELVAMRQAVGDMSSTAEKEMAKKVLAPVLFNTGKIDEINKQIDAYKGRMGLDLGGKGAGQNDPLRQMNSSIKAAEDASEQDSST